MTANLDLYGIGENLLVRSINQSGNNTVGVLTPYSRVEAKNRTDIKRKMAIDLADCLRNAGYSDEVTAKVPEFVSDSIDGVNPHPLSLGRVRDVADQIIEKIMHATGEL